MDLCPDTYLPILSSRPSPTEPPERETEEEWRDPDNVSSATPIRGVLPKLRVLRIATTRKIDLYVFG